MQVLNHSTWEVEARRLLSSRSVRVGARRGRVAQQDYEQKRKEKWKEQGWREGENHKRNHDDVKFDLGVRLIC